ncbi:hypothetical protein [Endozoicomonas sp. ISHI1]|uniref:hypothetical protein n=1 Tax=Endozoicomonas sp. ISHI1 TaxID=2825882 RepID=UPI0021487E51|nr:hypothetical protein [Endozoicomonas sp. ISHI1]
MIKLHYHLAQLIAPLFLLQVLSLGAQNAVKPTTPSGTTYPTKVLCDSLIGQPSGVRQRLSQYSELVRGRQCVVLSADPTKDLAQLINGLPDDTVILLSSSTTTTMTPSPSVATVAGKTPVNYFVGSEILLKNGQDIIGAADDGFEVVIMPDKSYSNRYMLRVGDYVDFKFAETKDSNIRHITFRDNSPEGHTLKRVNSIVYGECHNRRLIMENNVFHLTESIGVRLECRGTLDASANNLRTGPGLLFANNAFKGESYSLISNLDFIPLEALAVSYPGIKHQSEKLTVIDNVFQGKISEVGHFTLGSGSRMNIFRNIIDVDNSGTTYHEWIMGHSAHKHGFALAGLTDEYADADADSDSDAEPPLFNVAGNRISVKNTAINIDGELKLALPCNHLQAVKPWRQEQHKYSLIAIDPFPLAGDCKKPLRFHQRATKPQSAFCKIVNTWTPTNGSPAGTISGLTNLEGQFYFNSASCQTSTSTRISAAIKGTTVTMTALGIMTTLALLLNL